MNKYNVYDKVWIMESNKPKQMQVFAVICSADYFKHGTEIHYRLVSSMLGVGWGNNEGIRREECEMFSSKEELLASL